MINYSEEEKNIKWKYKDYSFNLPDTIEQLLKIDNIMQFSVNRARMDLIQAKQIIPVFVKKIEEYRIMILLKKNDNALLLDFTCGVQKTIPLKEEMNVIKAWCNEKKITQSNGVRLWHGFVKDVVALMKVHFQIK